MKLESHGAMQVQPLILASASPRRRELLTHAGYSFEVDPSEIDEPEPTGHVDPRAYSAILALRKALAVAGRHRSGLIVAADTVCTVDHFLLNKPTDRDDAERMLRLQEGRSIEVITALILYRVPNQEFEGAIETSRLRMRPLSNRERVAYLDLNHWQGKAGAYGVQDDDPIVTIESGSWSNIVGLPMERLASLLKRSMPSTP